MHLMIVVAAVLFVCGSARDLEPERDGRLELVAGRTGGDGARPGEAPITSPVRRRVRRPRYALFCGDARS